MFVEAGEAPRQTQSVGLEGEREAASPLARYPLANNTVRCNAHLEGVRQALLTMDGIETGVEGP